jgi:predicted enzyme related to lactoylglutathione lyase
MAARLTPIIIFVNRFERCFTFYQKVFGLKVLRIYRGAGHPRWAELQAGDIRLCLHGKYRGLRFRQGRPVAIHFDVKDIRSTAKKITRWGGRIRRPPTKYDYRPTELQVAYAATFVDPDGNIFEVQQVIEEFSD